MKLIFDNDDNGTIECDCGEEFDFDVHTEENLYYSSAEHRLIPHCPYCGQIGWEKEEND